MAKFLSAVILLLSPFSASAQEPTDGVYFCQGVGEAVAMIQYGRAYGIEDDENEAVEFIASLSADAEYDLLPAIDSFIRSSSPLPSAWTEILFTHACMYNYVDDMEQVKKISKQVPFQCDLQQPDVACFNGVLARIEQDRII